MKNRLFACLLASIASYAPIAAHAIDWTQAWVEGSGSCAAICRSQKAQPVESGVYKNGKPFYVCRADAHREGKRGGYNLEPSWSNSCTVGWGGREEATNPYECLCQR
jgi:hypothetical protein